MTMKPMAKLLLFRMGEGTFAHNILTLCSMQLCTVFTVQDFQSSVLITLQSNLPDLHRVNYVSQRFLLKPFHSFVLKTLGVHLKVRGIKWYDQIMKQYAITKQ